MKHRILPIVLFIFIVLFFFKPFLFENKLPIPSDTIVGLYHPFRDLFSKDYPNGIPFKNFLITDPVRQQYPWRDLVISIIKKFELPLWNPYNFSGTPLLANLQSAIFYPFNLVFFILPFNIGWSVLILMQPLLAGIFLYWYLRNLSIHRIASFLGSLVFAFCGFSVAWMEWGTILHVTLWLPLILLAIDKIFSISHRHKFSIFNFQFSILIWSFILVFSLVFSFFAGHLQVFFYVLLFSFAYILARWIQYGKIFNILFVFFIFYILFFILTAVQWIPTLQFVLQSARGVDQFNWQKDGWFIPWQHLIQFISPDFFGNPTTLNYWGVWNYGELIGYVGIGPLVMAIYALFFRHDKKTIFFGTIFFTSLIFALPTFLAKLPYILQIPFLSTSQPTRLLFIIDFSLAVLAAFGFDYFIRAKKKGVIYPSIFIGFILISLWVFTLFGRNFFQEILGESIEVSKRNLMLPTILFSVFIFLTLISSFLKKQKQIIIIVLCIIVGVTVFDLLRFADKFSPFTDQKYLFPQTKVISFLQENLGYQRFMTTDSRILPPNFSVIYKLQSVDGYDPLYTSRYGELIAASERNEPNISPPFGFNRIIAPHNYNSKIIDLLGVRYILSLSDLNSSKFKKVFQEGQTRVYENNNVLPRVFFVENIEFVNDKYDVIEKIFEDNFDLGKSAIAQKSLVPANTSLRWSKGNAKIVRYSENKISIKTENEGDGLLVLTDSFYPTWKVSIDGIKTEILQTDYNFRGIIVPKGKHTITFYNSLL